MRAVSDRLTQKTRTMRASVHKLNVLTVVHKCSSCASTLSLCLFGGSTGWMVGAKRREGVCVGAAVLACVGECSAGRAQVWAGRTEWGRRARRVRLLLAHEHMHAQRMPRFVPLAQTRSQISSARAFGCRFGSRSVSASAGFSCVPCLTRGRACWQSDLI